MRDPVAYHAPHVKRIQNVCFFNKCSQVTYFPVFICLILILEQLMKAEEKGSGSVAWSVYGAYIKAAGGPLVFIINIFFFLSTTGSIAFSNWWLSYWIRQGSGVSVKTTLLYCN